MIELEGVSKSFDGGCTLVVHPTDWKVQQGELIALVGTSGSGKTTLLKMINRLLEPDSGTVRIGGRAVTEVEEHVLRRSIGYVFQDVGLFPHLTVGENIAVTPRLLGWSQSERVARTEELLDLVGLPRSVAARPPTALSGGQRQRVGVARALAARPKLMLMDEPFGALDPVTREDLGTEYRNLHDQLGLTTVMVTHDILEAVLLADRIVVVRAGRIVADGTPSTLSSTSDDPAVRKLMELPRRQAERVQRRLSNTRG